MIKHNCVLSKNNLPNRSRSNLLFKNACEINDEIIQPVAMATSDAAAATV